MKNETYIFIIATIGVVLGITNFIRSLFKDRVKIKVSPVINLFIENPEGKNDIVSRVCIEVVNLSEFPITIHEVGFTTNIYKKEGKISFLDKQIVQGGKLPRKMESRTAITIYHPLPNMFKEDVDKIVGAYATTQCGRMFKGNNKILKKQIEDSKKLTKQST
ncbi:MAG: hypothetical protein KAS05_02895 [Candidatus Omnitrophica bacterium]|nr:hypothetical protein [Candidatus Omnitrophota bacterium]